jgi:hypothetical protein
MVIGVNKPRRRLLFPRKKEEQTTPSREVTRQQASPTCKKTGKEEK